MSAIPIARNVYSVGVKDPDLAVFDIIMPTQGGTSYNAFLVRGEKTALIDTVKKEFTDEFLANIAEVMPLEQIDYLVVNHNEPDHAGAISTLLDRCPELKIICSAAAMPFLKNVINRPADITGVKNNHELALGGKTLTFKLMPYMHWPDTMMDYLAEDKILFSNDGFAAHLTEESIWADEVAGDIAHEFYYYWDVIMRPFTGYQRRNLAKLDDLDIAMIAPSHGPLYRQDAGKLIEQYKAWAVDKAEGHKQVVIFYASNYGSTASLAHRLADRLTEDGFVTKPTDVTSCSEEEAQVLIESSLGVLIGTPTFNGDAVKPIWNLLNLFSTVYAIGKKAAVFGSYGWGGEGIKLVAERLTGLKLKVFEEQYRARLIPSTDEMVALDDWADNLAAFLNKGK